MLTCHRLPLVLSLCFFTTSSFAAGWRPVDPANLALKQSKSDPGADAEALFREEYVTTEQHGVNSPTTIIREYVRLKIYTDRGKDFANVQVPFFRDMNVFDVQGRTIHPDGSIVELSKDSIFEKEIEKRGSKTKVKSFAMPAVEPGSIIEYKFSKSEGEQLFRYRRLDVQSEYPVQEIEFFIKPISNVYVAYPTMRLLPFGCQTERGETTREGYNVVIVKNVPAFHYEPYSLPEYSAKQWILIYYEENGNVKTDKYWSALGKERYKGYGLQVKVNGEVKELASQLTSGATTDNAKLDKLLEYCRKQLKDVGGDQITTAELEKAKANKNTIDTIRRKEGDHTDIQLAFIALAQAAGFDARVAELSNRSSFLFRPDMQSAFFLNSFDVAVNVGGKWRFYDVTNPSLPGGQLRWQEQAVYALITDNKEPEMVITPMLSSKESSKQRLADLTLSEEGALEGDVREMLFGNEAAIWREENRHTNKDQREEALREDLKHRFPEFEVTNIRITESPDAAKPVAVVYHLVVPGYAQRTGKRLLVQPNYFAAGFGSRFTQPSRHNDVYFEFPWSEIDNVDLKIPPGFELDHGDAPANINIGTCQYAVTIAFDKAKNLIQYRRQMVFGDKDLLVFQAKIYPNVKKIFDVMHEGDNHMLTFKASAAPGAAGQ